MKSNICDVEVQLHHVTEKSWLVSLDGNKAKAVWVPKSQAEMDTSNCESVYILTAEEWLLLDKGLI